jgi:hypothetical protein
MNHGRPFQPLVSPLCLEAPRRDYKDLTGQNASAVGKEGSFKSCKTTVQTYVLHSRAWKRLQVPPVSAIPKFEAPMAKKLLLQFPGIIDCTLFTIIRGWHLIGEDF